MAYVYSKVQSFKDSNTYGNVAMEVNIYRGEVTRKEKSVSFKFGVSFKPTQYSTSNSIAAWYDGVQKFAYTNSGYSFESAPVTGKSGVTHHAYYTDRNSTRACTTANLCYSYSNSSIDADTTSVKVSIGVGWWDWAGSKKGTLTFSLAIPEYHGSIGTGTVYITDNGNNTFTITGTKGKNGINNSSSGPYLTYSYDDASYNKETNSGTAIALAGTAAERKIYAKCVTKAAYGSDTVATTSKTVKRYVKPGNPGKPTISYTRNRLTPKERIIYKWTVAAKGNSNSPVVGYRVRLYKNGVNIPIWSTTSNERKSVLNGTSTTDWIYDRVVDDPTYISLGHEIHGFKVGDKVKFSIQAYSKNGAGEKLLSDVMTSAETLIENAGIVNVNVSGSWKEGQVYVNVNGAWKEAESVNVNVNGSWRESE
jgi:hypothetical protein